MTPIPQAIRLASSRYPSGVFTTAGFALEFLALTGERDPLLNDDLAVAILESQCGVVRLSSGFWVVTWWRRVWERVKGR